MSTVIVAAEVFSKSDPTRACALVRRTGGELFIVQNAAGEFIAERTYATYDEAIAVAEQYADVLDGTDAGKLLAQNLRVQQQADQIVTLAGQLSAAQDEIAALKAKAAGVAIVGG